MATSQAMQRTFRLDELGDWIEVDAALPDSCVTTVRARSSQGPPQDSRLYGSVIASCAPAAAVWRRRAINIDVAAILFVISVFLFYFYTARP
jgi:hypothetical protein